MQVSVTNRAERLTDSGKSKRRTVILGSGVSLALTSGTAFAVAKSGCKSSAATGLMDFIKNAADFVIGLAAIGALLMLAIGAALIIFGGTPERVSKGMKIIKNVVIGLAILGAGAFIRYVVVDFVSGATGGTAGSKCLPINKTGL